MPQIVPLDMLTFQDGKAGRWLQRDIAYVQGHCATFDR